MNSSNFFKEGGAAHKSDRIDWETPQKLFEELHKEFTFRLDAAANKHNAKLEIYYDEIDNSLQQDWSLHKTVFLNPPYNRKIGLWIKKAYEEWQKGCTVVILMPARTDTSYWHDYIQGNAEVRFIRGRLKYELNGEPKDPAPFPSCIVIFREIG